MSFRSRQPATVIAYRYGRNTVIFGSTGSELVVRATVTRHGHVTVTPVNPACGGTGGGGTPPAPDCGTHRTQFDLWLEWRLDGSERDHPRNGTIVPLVRAVSELPGDRRRVPANPRCGRRQGDRRAHPSIRPVRPIATQAHRFGHGRVRRPVKRQLIDDFHSLDRVTYLDPLTPRRRGALGPGAAHWPPTPKERFSCTFTRTLIAAGVGLLCAAAPAGADSIAYIKDNNIWLARPDGSGQVQITHDGTATTPYRSPSQADNGTIAAGHGSDLVTLAQTGQPLAEFAPPTATDSTGRSSRTSHSRSRSRPTDTCSPTSTRSHPARPLLPAACGRRCSTPHPTTPPRSRHLESRRT